MKKFTALLICCVFAAFESAAYDVKVVYDSKDYATNFFTSVPDGESFYYDNFITKDLDIINLDVRRIPPQKYDKNFALIVGVEDFAEGQLAYNDTSCIDDICNTIFYGDKYTLYGSQATKYMIRNSIQLASTQLAIKDTFLFYFSGTITSEGGLQCCNNEVITKEEFFDDLALFSTDTRIVIILDADNAEKLLSGSPGDERIFIYCDKKLSKKYKEEMSPFTLALGRSFNNITDGDENGLLSFEEMYNRARNFIVSKKYKVSPSGEFGKISSPLYWAMAPDHECDGAIQINNGHFLLKVPSIDSDTEIEIKEGTWEGIFPFPVVMKGNFKANLKQGLPYPTKFSLNYKLDNYYSIFSYAIYLNNEKVKIGPQIKESKSSITYAIEDYEFKNAGKFVFKKKKNVFKLTFKGASHLADAFIWDNNPENVQITFRDYTILFHDLIQFNKKYTDGKKLTAKVPKRK